MEIKLFMQMLQDKHFPDYEKMKHKYSDEFADFLTGLAEIYYVPLCLDDFNSNKLVYMKNISLANQNAVKKLLRSQTSKYGISAAEDEIIASSAIESIDFNRSSVRNILKGLAPKDDEENRIYGIKKGLDFISDTTNKITEENLYKLYMMTVGDFLDGEDKLAEGNFYRHDTVYVMSDRLEHAGLSYVKVPQFMKSLIDFANSEDSIDDLTKGAIIHFYIAYVHPYFDGNGRIARLVNLWYLIQRGYESTLFMPFSSLIASSRKEYYNAFTLIEKNRNLSGKIDVTPFIIYMNEKVYNKINTDNGVLSRFSEALKTGAATKKEAELWKFVLSFYGTDEFSTKQLERDYGEAAYATIRNFVLKFESMELLVTTRYGHRTRYRVRS